MECRPGCGACCIAPSISSPLPDLPQGKAAGERCPHLNEENLCHLFGNPLRPAVCARFTAQDDSCGANRDEALGLLTRMEQLTA